MARRTTELAIECTKLLNGSEFQAATAIDAVATRQYVPTFEAEEISEPKLCVVAGGLARSIAGRTAVQEDYHVQIGVLKKLEQTESHRDDTEVADDLCDFVEDLMDFFLPGNGKPPRQIVTDENRYVCIETQTLPAGGSIYDHEDFDSKNQFTAVVDLTFRQIR